MGNAIHNSTIILVVIVFANITQRNQPMICTILIPDRTGMDIAIESYTFAEDLLSRIADKLKIPDDEFQEFYLYSFVPEKKGTFRSTDEIISFCLQ